MNHLGTAKRTQQDTKLKTGAGQSTSVETVPKAHKNNRKRKRRSRGRRRRVHSVAENNDLHEAPILDQHPNSPACKRLGPGDPSACEATDEGNRKDPIARSTKEGDVVDRETATESLPVQKCLLRGTVSSDVALRLEVCGRQSNPGKGCRPDPEERIVDLPHFQSQERAEEIASTVDVHEDTGNTVEGARQQGKGMSYGGTVDSSDLPTVHAVPETILKGSKSVHVFHQTDCLRTHESQGQEHTGFCHGHGPPQRATTKMVSQPAVTRRGGAPKERDGLARIMKSTPYDPCEDIVARTTQQYSWDLPPKNDDGILDPIPEGLVGSIDLSKLPKYPSSSPIGLAQDILFDDQKMHEYLHADRPTLKFIPSNKKHVKFVTEMITSGLCSKKDRKDKEFGFAKFFTVLKKINTDLINILRTILDPETANESFVTPPPVNLPTLIDILESFAVVEKIRILDLRHMYHQIHMGDHMRKWFTLAFGSLRLQWNALPMGFKWSCFIAQAITTFAIAGAEVATVWTSIPKKIVVGKVVVYCVYDNVAVGGPAADVDDFWNHQLLPNLGSIGAIVKESSEAIEGQSVDLLGLRWFPSQKGLQWIFLEKFLDKLECMEKRMAMPITLTAKELASALGLVAWGTYATFGTLFDQHSAYRRLTEVVNEQGWNGVDSSIHYACILSALRRLRCAGRQSFNTIKEEVLVFSDASTTGFGYVGGYPLSCHAGTWSRLFQSKDIFHAEALAAKMAVSTFQKPNRRIYVATDNKGLYFAIRKRSCACPRTAPLLQAMFDNHRDISAGWIATEANPADELSRGKRIDMLKLKNAPAVVEWASPLDSWRGSKLGRVVGHGGGG